MKTSERLQKLIDELPLQDGMRIMEIGCGSGSAAREILKRFEKSYILAVDRSEKAISQAMKQSKKELSSGRLKLVRSAIEEIDPEMHAELFDLAFAIRVGALDGRHPKLEAAAKEKIRMFLKPTGKLFVEMENQMLEMPV